MAIRTLIRNIAGQPMPLPMPYGGILAGGEGTIVEETDVEVIAYFGGRDAVRWIWEIVPVNPASPLGPITSRHGGNTTAAAIASLTTPLVVNNQPIQNVAPPTQPNDATTKAYVDNMIAAAISSPAGEPAAEGDLSGLFPAPQVVGLRGRSLSDTAPADGEAVTWHATSQSWKPAPPSAALIPNGTISRTKLTASGVTSGIYGSSGAVPVLTVDAHGIVTHATTAPIASPVMRVLSFDEGRVRVVAFGPAALLEALVAAKDFSTDGVSTLTIAVPGLLEPGQVVIQHVAATFLSSETSGRSAIRVEIPAPAQGPSDSATPTDLTKETRPLLHRLSQVYGVAHVGGSIAGLPFGRLRLEQTGFTPATEQRVILSL